MRRLHAWMTVVVSMAAAFAPGLSAAQWRLLLDNERGRSYISTGRWPVSPGVVRVRGLQEPHAPTPVPGGLARSAQSLEELDCPGRRTRLLQLEFKEEAGGNGRTVLSGPVGGDWAPLDGAYAEALWRDACAAEAGGAVRSR